MIRKIFYIILISIIISSSIYSDSSEDRSDAFVWIQMNNTLALNLDLSKTITLPKAGANWPSSGYNNDNYLGKIGSYGISDPVYLDVYCNHVDDQGHFIMVSQSSKGLLYRKFKLGLAYRASYWNGHANYYPGNESTSFFEFDSAGPAPYPLPSYVVNGSGTLNYSWVDFLIMMDDYTTNGDSVHLSSANDYQCILTVVAHTADNRFYQVMDLPLLGYFDMTPSESAGECFLDIVDYGEILDVKNMSYSELQTVGTIQFTTISMERTKNYNLYISPSTLYNDASDFVLKRVSSVNSGLNDTNHVPLRIYLKGTQITGTNLTGTDLDSEVSRSVTATKIQQGNGTNVSSAIGESATISYGYNADVQVSLTSDYDTAKLDKLVSGEYSCTVYFLVYIN